MAVEPQKLRTILVVDDDEITRMMLFQTLSDAGYRVVEADNGESGVERFQQIQPDLVLMDVLMPRKDGFEACAEIRRSAQFKHTPILLMTASDDVSHVDQAFNAGATDFITKPLNWTLLAQRVRYALRARDMDRELERQQIKLSHAQRIARLAYWEYDLERDLIFWSDDMEQVLGIPAEREGISFEYLLTHYIHPEDQKMVEQVMDAALTNHDDYGIEHRVILPDGTERIVYSRGEMQYNAKNMPIYMLAVVQDITELRRAQKQLSYLTNHDYLTGLPNRVLLQDRLQRLILNAKRRERMVAVMFLSIDGFRHINTTLGTKHGDIFLKTIAERLQQCIRTEDTVGRWGGDEFMVILADLAHVEDSARVANQLLASLRQPLHLGGHELFSPVSIGIALYPLDHLEPEILHQNAAVAMSKARDGGCDTYRFYTSDMNARALERLALESDLRHALERQEYIVYYQPQIDLQTGAVVGFEALLRWQRQGELVSPIAFIPLLEQTGLISAVGAWVLTEASRQCQQSWRSVSERFRVSVNVSSKQLNSQLINVVADVLKRTRLDAKYIELEITESIIMEDVKSSMRTLHAIADMGVHIAIDDFGTGYSSLAYLKRLPVHTLKIDMSFVLGMAKNADDAAIVRSTIDLAHNLGLTVIAEGVSDEPTTQLLRTMNCDIGQGFHIGQPMPFADCQNWLKRGPEEAPRLIPAMITPLK